MIAFDSARAAVLKDASLGILRKNRRTTNGFQYTVPSPLAYPYQWFWDSCFHAIVLAHFDPEDAKSELRSLLAHQFENGMIPHMIYWERGSAIDIKWGKDHTSSITQPPLIAEAVLEIYRKDGDASFLREIFPKLYHYYNYLLSERDPRRHHLAGILNPDESGEDDSPRFDAALGLPPRHSTDENFGKRLKLVEELAACNFDAPFCMKQFFWVKDVPFNAVLVENLRALGQIAEAANFPEEALFFAGEALQVTRSMRDRMLENGVFWPVQGENYERIKVATWAMFMPLYAHLLSSDEAARLVHEHFLSPSEFAAPFSLPTVAMNEASYDPDGFWRGPVWMASNWFVFRGLMDYGFEEEARGLLESSAKLIETSGFREHFHPQTGAGQGAKDFTWGALVADMLAYEPQERAAA